MNKIIWLIARHWFDVDVMEPMFEEMMLKDFDAYLGVTPYIPFRGRWRHQWRIYSSPHNNAPDGWRGPPDAIFHSGAPESYFVNRAFLVQHSLGDIHISTEVKSHFVSGQFWSDYVRYHKCDRVRITGVPKLDFLFQPAKKASIMKETAEKYGLDDLPYDKTVLYAPGGRYDGDKTSFDDLAEPLLNAIGQLKVNFIIKPYCGYDVIVDHPQLGRVSKYGHLRKVEKIKHKIKNITHMRWIPGSENVAYLFPFSDVLVSTQSSALWEFMATDKPSIQVGGEAFKRKRDEFFSTEEARFSYWRVFGGTVPVIFNESPTLGPLKKVIEEAVNDPNLGKGERDEWKPLMLYKLDGQASKRVVDNMIDAMGWQK